MITIEPEILWSLYWGNGYSLREISNNFGCSCGFIRKRMIKYEIPRRIAGAHGQIIIEPDLLVSLYWGNGYTLWQIADIFSCDRGVIKRRMIEYNIPCRIGGTIEGSTMIPIEPEILWALYWGNGYTLRQIANTLGYDYGTIKRRMIEHSIPCRIAGGPKQIIIEPELLWALYWGNGYTLREIGNIFGWGDQPILNRMKEHGIPSRHTGCELTDFTFNARQKEIFEGCMLGDGGLTWRTNYCCFCNADIHREYLIWLQKQLGIEDISNITVNINDVYRLLTRVIPSIQGEHKRWYPYETRKGTIQNHNNKTPPKDVKITPIKMLFWYIGDGTYSKRDKATYFTNPLYFDDWVSLSDKISNLLDVDNGISIFKSRKDKMGRQRYALRLNKGVTGKFFDMVDSLGFDIPECYQYKFGR